MKTFKEMTFLEQLEELKSTMQEAMKAEDARLEMSWWWTKKPAKPHHFCNSACCILGYQAVKDYVPSHEEWEVLEYLTKVAGDFSNDLDNSCKDLCDNDCLSSSVYVSCVSERKEYAELSNLFTQQELDTIVHLNSDTPTFQDAIDYLQICIEKVKEHMKPNNLSDN